MENASKSLLEIPLFSRSFPFMSRPDLGTWPFFDSWNSSVLSSQDTVNSTIITNFGYTDHKIYILSEVWTCYVFLGLPSFASCWDDIIWYSVCTTGRWDLLKASIVSYLSERAASCTRIGEENSIEVAHISTTFVRIVCSTSSYYIELVTERVCLFFYMSDFCLHHSFTTTHFSLVCFLSLSVSSGDQAFSTSNCRA